MPFEVVPGVTSALAALSYAGVPVTDRRHAASFHVLTGHRRGDGELGIDYEALVRAGGTDVFLMAARTLGQVAGGLLAAGADPATPACVVERGTLPEQRRIDATLATVEQEARAARVQSPAILVVGDVCTLAPELDWFDALPLRGRTVAVTRPRDRASGLVEGLRARGAEVCEVPLIETRPRPAEELARALAGLGAHQWLVLTSAEGVRCLRLALDAAGLDARAGVSRLTVVLAGVALNAIFGAAQNAVLIIVPNLYVGASSFLVGGFSGVLLGDLGFPAVFSLAGFAVALVLAPTLNVLTLGSESAHALGVRVSAVRVAALAAGSLLAASAVSFAGLLGFVGLVVPHLVRRVFGVDAHRLVPLCAVWGAAFTVACDTFARTAFAPHELPVGIVLAFVGGPFFIYLIMRGRGDRDE